MSVTHTVVTTHNTNIRRVVSRQTLVLASPSFSERVEALAPAAVLTLAVTTHITIYSDVPVTVTVGIQAFVCTHFMVDAAMPSVTIANTGLVPANLTIIMG